jgi:hypothetical protein
MSGTFSFEQAQGGAAAPAPGAPAPAPGTFSFEEAAKPPPKDPRTTGLIANYGAGTSEKTAEFLGLPVDLMTGAINLVPRAINAATDTQHPTIQNPVGGSEWWKSAFGYLGADPRTIVPGDEAEQIARAAGGGTASMILPWGVARALPVLAGIPGAFQRSFGAGGAPSQAVIGGTAGAGGQIAANAVPEPYKPLAQFGGQLLAGGVAGLAAGAGRTAVNTLGGKIGDYVAPMYATGQQRLAAARVGGAASNLPEVRATLAEDQPPLVPGSQPTTFQLTGDQGLGNLERVVAKNSPDVWMARLGEQNQARVNAIGGMAPETASPDAVGGFFRQQLSDIDAAHTAQIDAARTGAREAVNNLGGAAPLGDANSTSVLQGFGQRLRAGLDALNTGTRAQVSKLYTDVDPDGTLALGMTPIRQAANDIVGARPANAAPLSGDAAGIFRTAQGLPETQLFGEAAALRSRITDAMREELYNNGRSTTYRTLVQLQKAVDNTLSGGVEQRAASDAAAVQAGHATPEQTMLGRLKAGQGDGTQQVGGVGNPVFPGQGAIPRPAGGQPGGYHGPGGAPQIPGGAGNQVTPRGLPGPSGGNRDVAAAAAALAQKWGLAPGRSAPLEPNYDPEAIARYRDANAAHAERVATYDEAPGVGAVLGTGRRAGEWRLGDSQVAATLFNSGKGAAERVQAFMRAGGSSPALVSDLKDYAAFSLRHAAEEADGTLSPARAQRWLAAHDEALSAFPELRARFADAAQQRQLVDDAVVRHQAARTAIEDSAARRFLGDADPTITIGRILRSDTAEATMADLAQRAANNPAARAGLQRGAVDFILQELRSNTVVGQERMLQPDKFTRFIQNSSRALGKIFSPEQVEAIQNTAIDLQRSQRSVSGTKLPGGSNTAQDLAAGEQHGGGHPSTVGMLAAMEGVGEAAGHALGPLGRVAGMIGVPILNAMRQNGLQKVNDLVEQMMMHPEIARTMLEKYPASLPAAQSLGQRLGRQLQALALTSPLRPTQQQTLPPTPPGLASPPAPRVIPNQLLRR